MQARLSIRLSRCKRSRGRAPAGRHGRARQGACDHRGVLAAPYPLDGVRGGRGIRDTSRASARRCLLTLTELGYLEFDGKYFRPQPRLLALSRRLFRHALVAADRAAVPQGRARRAARIDLACGARSRRRAVRGAGRGGAAGDDGHLHRYPDRSLLFGDGQGAALGLAGRRASPPISIASRSKRAPNIRWSRSRRCARPCAARADRVYATTDQELEIGLRSIAVPVIDSRGTRRRRHERERLDRPHVPPADGQKFRAGAAGERRCPRTRTVKKASAAAPAFLRRVRVSARAIRPTADLPTESSSLRRRRRSAAS